jgi:hypothetical protein
VNLFLRVLVLIAALSATGCVYTSYTDKEGRKLTRISLFGNQAIGKVNLTTGTIEDYDSEQTKIAGAVVEAAVRAAIKP